MNVSNKEQIKDRLVKIAAEKWNVQESEVDANFDPLVLLLFDALASELEGLGHMIKDIQGNLLQELSALMLPQTLLSAKPASCILSAMPVEDTCTVLKNTSFATTTELQKTGEKVRTSELNFTPIGAFKLLHVEPGHLLMGQHIFKLNIDGRKALLHEGSRQQQVQEFLFTIQNPKKLLSLKGLQILFNLKGHSEASAFYNALQQARLFINGAPAHFSNGYFNAQQFDITLKEALAHNGDYAGKIHREIAGIYARQLLHLTSETIPDSELSEIPALQQVPETLLKEIQTPDTVFISVQLNRPFAMDVLERLQIGLNAFPVVNRSLEKVHAKTDRWINIIPLPVNGSFLDIDQIEAADGGRYRLHENVSDKDLKEGEAIVRVARVSKSSSAEIRTTIEGLLSAIRDESAYFSRVSNDFVASRLVEISKILTRLEDQITLSNDEKPSFRYLLLKPRKQGESIEASYWVTDPLAAASVKAGQAFRAVNHTLTSNSFSFSLTAAAGGADTPGHYVQKQMLVRQLSSGGKLVSLEDIKLLCYEIFENKLVHVHIDKVMKIQPGNKAGISRAIQIDIAVAAGAYTSDELSYLESHLQYQLTTHGLFVFPFSINISEV
ncbi:hypothetical protein ABDK00_018455 [Niabella insulamsoli]|uniref:hypothetical protein n=1 Tax=Niabella insulamsoli TaxID=3144874 RepID=UPI0031FBF735